MLRDNLFLASLAVLILLVVAVLGLVLWMAVRRSSAKGAADPKIAKMRFDSLRNSFRQAVELIEANIAARSNPSGRASRDSDYASLVEYLLSPDAEFVQGQVIAATGGTGVIG